MNDRDLTTRVFPLWANDLLKNHEVWVDIDVISQFSSYLRTHHEPIWLKTEQDPGVNDEWKTRFYLRSYPTDT